MRLLSNATNVGARFKVSPVTQDIVLTVPAFAICSKKCTVCEVEYDSRMEHEFYKIYCRRCKMNDNAGHQCYMLKHNLDKLIEQDQKLKVRKDL